MILRTVACQAALCMGVSKQEYWSGVPFPSLGDLPDPGLEPTGGAIRECKIQGALRLFVWQLMLFSH